MGRLGDTWPVPGTGKGQRHWIESSHPYAKPNMSGHRENIPWHLPRVPAAPGDTMGSTLFR